MSDYSIPEHDPSNIKKTEQYKKAVDIVVKNQRASVSFIQRQLVIGYNQAARIMETMEIEGVVSKFKADGTRDV